MKSIAIFGAGAIGCYLAGVWAPALSARGIALTVVGRARLLDPIAADGLMVNGTRADLTGVTFEVDPSALSTADLILVTCKTTSIESIRSDLIAHARPGTPVLSLMNGLAGLSLPDSLPELAGMVPFNVAWDRANSLHRSSAGDIVCDAHPQTKALQDAVAGTDAPVTCVPDVTPMRRGKLLLNLVNPVNALSGLPLRATLAQQGYRRVFAASIAEALAVYDATQATWQKVGPFSPRVASLLLRLPDAVFNATVLKVQKIDASSLTSMAQDVQAGRPTEIDALNGEIVRMGQAVGQRTPVNAALVAAVQSYESRGTTPNLSADEMLALTAQA